MELSNIKPLENIITTQLKSLGYFSVEILNENDKSFNVVAQGSLRKIFLKVVIRFMSEQIDRLSSEEINIIKHNASSRQKEPWAAIMNINDEGKLIDRVKWKNLSKEFI